MEKTRALGALLVLFALSGCGGGGGGGDEGGSGLWGPGGAPTTPTTPAPAPTPEVRLVLSTPPIATSLPIGGDVTVAGQWTATSLGSSQVFLQVSDDGGTFVVPPVAASTSPDFSHVLPLAETVAPGTTRAGNITVRACEDVQCVKPYANASQTLTYTVTITPAQDWETTQGNAAHNGYVPITLDATRFAKAWEWKRPGVSMSGTTGAIYHPVTAGRLVFVTANGINSSGPAVFAINEADGLVKWTQPFTLSSSGATLNPPAVSEGTVYVPTTGHADTFLWSFDAADGTPRIKSSFRTQWYDILAPTVSNGIAYLNAGYTTGVVYAFDRTTGTKTWEASAGTAGLNTPALDNANRLYAMNGDSLNILDARNGTLLGNIGPISGGMQADYDGTAIVGADDSVTALVGERWDDPDARQLRNYAIESKTVRWTSVKTYRRYPAVAKGVIYATSNNPLSFDALDEKTGQLLWSWSPVSSDNGFIHNVVVTDNLAFVSTTRSLYAIDLATHKPVWQTAEPGYVAISGTRMIYVMTGVLDDFGWPLGGSDGRLLAYRTR